MACSITPARTKKLPSQAKCTEKEAFADEEFADDCRQ